jgi:hypothetical protein
MYSLRGYGLWARFGLWFAPTSWLWAAATWIMAHWNGAYISSRLECSCLLQQMFVKRSLRLTKMVTISMQILAFRYMLGWWHFCLSDSLVSSLILLWFCAGGARYSGRHFPGRDCAVVCISGQCRSPGVDWICCNGTGHGGPPQMTVHTLSHDKGLEIMQSSRVPCCPGGGRSRQRCHQFPAHCRYRRGWCAWRRDSLVWYWLAIEKSIEVIGYKTNKQPYFISSSSWAFCISNVMYAQSKTGSAPVLHLYEWFLLVAYNRCEYGIFCQWILAVRCDGCTLAINVYHYCERMFFLKDFQIPRIFG